MESCGLVEDLEPRRRAIKCYTRVTIHIANQDAKTFPNKLADVHQELINLEAATGKSTIFGSASIHSHN